MEGALEPQLAELLAGEEAAPVEELTPAGARAEHERRSRELVGPGEPVAAVEELSLGGGVPARLYRPAARDGLPVVVWLHGGGWVIGTLDTYDTVARALALASGAAVVSVGYRLAPEHPYPAAVEDAEAAVRGVAERAAALGLDGGRLAVAGDSAGGNLSAVVARRLRDMGGPALRLQALVYPVTDAGARGGPPEVPGAFTRAEMDWYWEQYLQGADGLSPDASPLRVSDLSGLPPAYVVLAAHDPLLGEGERYAEGLRAAGVPVAVRRYDGMVHGFLRWRARLDRARTAMDELGAAVRAALA